MVGGVSGNRAWMVKDQGEARMAEITDVGCQERERMPINREAVMKRKKRRGDKRGGVAWSGLEVLEGRLLLSATLGGFGDDDFGLGGFDSAYELGVDDDDVQGVIDAVFAPGTPIELVERFENHNAVGNDLDLFQVHPSGRWSSTLTDGGGLSQGDATTLTWSIVPDGTFIDNFAGGQIPTELASDSDLVSWLDGIYGDVGGGDIESRSWFGIFNDMFERWGAISGMEYIYEPNDDGADMLAGGALGVRGEVRIGGHFIDGDGSVLAYNFFPVDSSSMVIDTGDGLFGQNLQQDSIFLRNTVAHEHGHGLGVSHVGPTDNTKLMEPYLNLNFNGPQFDDILVSQRLYGDDFEQSGGNDSVGTATDLGLIADGRVSVGVEIVTTVIDGEVGFVSIDGSSDSDYYSFTVGANQRVNLRLDPEGVSYQQGPQGGGTTSFNAKGQNNLGFNLIDSDGQTVLLEVDFTRKGLSEEVDVVLLEAGEYYLQVVGGEDAVQMYTLDVTVSENVGGASGSVAFDAEKYLPDTLVSIMVSDVDQASLGSMEVTVVSTGGDIETVTLIEQLGGLFRGSIQLGSGGGTSDGTLDVELEDEITVTYIDLDDEVGNQVTRSDTAIIAEQLTNIREFVSEDVPLYLDGLATQSSFLLVEAGGIIHDLDVTFSLDHKNFIISNLLVTLHAPNGQSLILFDGVGGFGTEFYGTILDDEASVSIVDGQAPFTGRFRPYQLLSELDGKVVTGLWALEILDTTFEVFQSTGALTAWSIVVELGDESPEPPAPDPETPAPGKPDLAAGSDTGSSDSDSLTQRDNDGAEGVLEFLVPDTIAGATVSLYSGTTKIGEAVASGTSTVILTNGVSVLADGSHTITARQVESGKAASAAGTGLRMTVDTTAEVVTVDMLETESFRPALSGTVSDSNASVEISVGGGVYAADVIEGRWGLSADVIDPELEPGVYDVVARVTDRAGNVGVDETVDELLVINPRTEFEADDVPVVLDAGPHLSVIEVVGEGYIHDLDVLLDIDHSFAADLDVFLIAPDGRRIELFTDVGTGGNDFTGTVLDDEAEDGIADGVAPFEGRYRPEGVLGELDGLAIAGLWTLEIMDDTPLDIDSGVLKGWAVSFEVGPEFSTTPDAPDLLAMSDTGFNSGDDLTRFDNDGAGNVLRFLASGVEAGAEVSLFANGVLVGGAVAASTEVVIETDGVLVLDEGKTEFTLRQVGLGKAASDASEGLLVTIDKTAPVLTVDEMVTSSMSPELGGTVDDAGAVLFVSVGGVGVLAMHDGEGRWMAPSGMVTPQLVDGVYDVHVVGIDAAGNTGSDVTAGELRVDMTSPEIVIDVARYTQDRTPEIRVEATDPSGIREGSVVLLDIDLNNDGDFEDAGEVSYSLSLMMGGVATVSNVSGLANGVYGLRAHVSDSLGNAGVSGVTRIVVGTDLAGDFDFNLQVDVADLSVWASGFGGAGGFGSGDANLDGQVDVADLSVWASTFGSSSEPLVEEVLVENSAAVMLITDEPSGGDEGVSFVADAGDDEEGGADDWGHIRSLLDRVEGADGNGAKKGIVNLLRGGLRGLRVAVMGGVGV